MKLPNCTVNENGSTSLIVSRSRSFLFAAELDIVRPANRYTLLNMLRARFWRFHLLSLLLIAASARPLAARR